MLCVFTMEFPSVSSLFLLPLSGVTGTVTTTTTTSTTTTSTVGVVAVLLLAMYVGPVSSDTTDFSNPIVCYTCRGDAVNSSCADPVDPRTNVHLVEKECKKGVCLKWTKYEGGSLKMIRTCSAELNFYLTMIDGVCRTERYGNGFLCMCGKHLCNSARPVLRSGWVLAILLAAYSVIVQRRL